MTSLSSASSDAVGRDDVKRYEVGGKAYEQRYPVLGQLLAVSELIMDIDPDTPRDRMLDVLGVKQFELLAVILVPEGMQPRAVDRADLAEELRYSLRATQAQEVVADFFGWPGMVEEWTAMNGMHGLMNSMVGVVAQAREKLSAGPSSGNGSGTSSEPSAAETSPAAT